MDSGEGIRGVDALLLAPEGPTACPSRLASTVVGEAMAL